MAFTSTASIYRRVEAALTYDLLGGYTPTSDAERAADNAVNDALSGPLNTSPVCERVERNVIDPIGAGDLYAVNGRTGMTVLYSDSTQQPSAPQGGTAKRLRRAINCEITILRVVTQMDDVIGGAAGYDVDAVIDDIQRIFSSKRRDATDFGVQTLQLGNVNKLDGGSAEAPWHGRIMQLRFERSQRNLLT